MVITLNAWNDRTTLKHYFQYQLHTGGSSLDCKPVPRNNTCFASEKLYHRKIG